MTCFLRGCRCIVFSARVRSALCKPDHDANGCLLRSRLCPVLSARVSSPLCEPDRHADGFSAAFFEAAFAQRSQRVQACPCASGILMLMADRMLLSKLPLHGALSARKLAHVRARSSCQRFLSCFLRSCLCITLSARVSSPVRESDHHANGS